MRDVTVDIITHEKTGLLVATSPDLMGLYAHGRTIEDLERAITTAIKDILEAKLGAEVTVIKKRDDQRSGFSPNAMTFAADRAMAA